MAKIAAVLIRGTVHVRHDIKEALTVMNLLRKHVCVVLDDNAVNQGLLRKCKDYITYGPVDEATLKLLQEKRGKSTAKENVFRLSPPRGGFERAGIKVSYQNGGVLGLRKETMGELIARMV